MMKCIFFNISLLILTVVSLCCAESVQKNSWKELQNYYQNDLKDKNETVNEKIFNDPWTELRQIYLPFTKEEDTSANIKNNAGKKVYKYLSQKLNPFRNYIENCSNFFNIPKEIIGAVIMVESSGNPKAKAQSTSAKGLMQTIDSTFTEARLGLEKMNISIENNPYNPRSSIYAGSWYLNKMFKLVSKKNNVLLNRKEMNSWKIPLQCYYAGPSKGKRKEDIILIYRNGKKVRINKNAYSKKVFHWANILRI